MPNLHTRSIPLAAIFAVALAGCASSAARTTGVTDPLRFLALGDSYTIGERVAVTDRWPVQVARLVRENGGHVADPLIIARTGWTTDELASAIESEHPTGPFALVTLLIGVNDQYRGGDSAAYRPRFRSVLARAVSLAGGQAGRVVVLSIPDWGVTPFAEGRDRARIAADIDGFNAVNRAETAAAGARYVDITPESRLAASDASLVASDGLHPSGRMYAEWARLALQAVREVLAGQ